jgi:glycosyl transferase family 11
MGGLGNQMFDYAASLYYARQWGSPLELLSLPKSRSSSYGYARPFQLSCFQIGASVSVASLIHRLHQTNVKQIKPVVAICNSCLGIVCLPEPKKYAFHPDLKPPEGTRRVYLRGYWQAYGYVRAMETQLRNDFRFRAAPLGQNRDMLDRIQSTATTISVHVRRGDYLHVGMALPACYYDRAIAYMSERFPDATFVIFSDDMEFVRSSLANSLKAIYVEGNGAETAYEDLRLMSVCTHHIIANSTFSWWGAWLNPSASKVVVAPRNWSNIPNQDFSELYPPQWTLLDNRSLRSEPQPPTPPPDSRDPTMHLSCLL